MGVKHMSKRLKFLTQLHEIVDLTIIGNPKSPIRRAHRLMARFRHIDNRQTAMDEERLADNVLFYASAFAAPSLLKRDPSLIIWAAMSQIFEEAVQPLSLDRAGRKQSKTGY